MIEQHLHPFFWDTDIENFEPEAYPRYTIARLLEYGNAQAITWLKQRFSEESIKGVIRADRSLSPKSATFWALVYHIPTEEIAALKN